MSHRKKIDPAVTAAGWFLADRFARGGRKTTAAVYRTYDDFWALARRVAGEHPNWSCEDRDDFWRGFSAQIRAQLLRDGHCGVRPIHYSAVTGATL